MPRCLPAKPKAGMQQNFKKDMLMLQGQVKVRVALRDASFVAGKASGAHDFKIPSIPLAECV